MGRRSKGRDEIDVIEEKTFRRLPKCVVPVHYDLTFQPENEEPIMNGRMSVRVQVMCETKEIVLNAANMILTNVMYTPVDGESQESKDIVVNESTETVQIGFLAELQKGLGTLSLEFEAQITDNMKGLYRTESGNDRPGRKYNFITHFEPVHARRCFPCFDEPAFKATFGTTIIVPKDVVAISNMPLKEERSHEKNEDLKVCIFHTTPKMSTYLIAMVIGDFDYIETMNKDGIKIRVYTPPGKKIQGHFALDLAAKLLSHYTEYFGIPYPLPKCDLVAIREFPIGGMENYGLIIFRDTRLLVDCNETSALIKQTVALIVSHEVSHLWFGDLVTMKWWTDLWLKEGFAKFIEYLAVNKFFPEFDMWTQFVTRILVTAFNTDSLKHSHPIEVPVTNPSEIDEIFDTISYNKGASIIKMLYNYVGDASFRKGMNAYLERFKFSNAETADLWDALAKASGKSIGKVMDTFTKQMGYPLVTVLDVQHDTGTGSRTFTLKQEKFWGDPKLKGSDHGASPFGYKWVIPITFCKASNPNKVALAELYDGLESDTTKIVVPDVTEDEWVKLNAGMVGFYRVRYSPEVLAQFRTAIKTKTMSSVDRLGLLDDLYAAVKAGWSSTTDILTLLEAFKNEDDYSVWSCIRDITATISNLLIRTDLAETFSSYCSSLYKPLLQRMGWEAKPNEGHTDALLRALVINRLISCVDKETINEAEKFFGQHLKGEKKIPADLRTAVYRATLMKGNSETLDKMFDIYRNSELSEEKNRILQTLGSVADKALMQKILGFAISPEVKLNDVDSVLFSLNHSKHGQDLSWQFFKDNIKLFQEKYPGGMLICSVVRIVTGNLVGDEFANDVESFLQENRIHGTDRTVQQTVENIRINSSWLKRDFDSISTFLESQK